DMAPRRNGIGDTHHGRRTGDCLGRLGLQNGIGPFRHRRPRHDPHRLPGPDIAGKRTPREDLADDAQFKRVVGASAECFAAPQGVAVHRRSIEAWNVNVRDDVSGENPIRYVRKDNGFFGEWTHALLEETDDVLDLRPIPKASHAYVVSHIPDCPMVDWKE